MSDLDLSTSYWLRMQTTSTQPFTARSVDDIPDEDPYMYMCMYAQSHTPDIFLTTVSSTTTTTTTTTTECKDVFVKTDAKVRDFCIGPVEDGDRVWLAWREFI